MVSRYNSTELHLTEAKTLSYSPTGRIMPVYMLLETFEEYIGRLMGRRSGTDKLERGSTGGALARTEHLRSNLEG